MFGQFPGNLHQLQSGALLVFAFFIIKDGDRFWTWMVATIDDGDRRQRVERIGQRSWVTLRNYLGGTALVGLADAVLIGIGLLILGVPLVVPLALLVFFGAFFLPAALRARFGLGFSGRDSVRVT